MIVGSIIKTEPSAFGFNIYEIGQTCFVGIIPNKHESVCEFKKCTILEFKDDDKTALIKIEGINEKVLVRSNILKSKPRNVTEAIVISCE